MAKYCVKCGRKLPDGGICPCRIKKISWPSEKKDIFQNKNGVSFWKILGLNDPEYDDKQDFYERGKKIVPDVIAPIESEVPIKQYHVADLRARLQGLWAEGRLMITNKRVLFRASGRSFFGRTQVQSEYTIDEISGFNISRGIRFGGVDIFLALLILALSVYGSNILSTLIEKWFVSLLFMILGFVGLVVIPAVLLKNPAEHHGPRNEQQIGADDDQEHRHEVKGDGLHAVGGPQGDVVAGPQGENS